MHLGSHVFGCPLVPDNHIPWHLRDAKICYFGNLSPVSFVDEDVLGLQRKKYIFMDGYSNEPASGALVNRALIFRALSH